MSISPTSSQPTIPTLADIRAAHARIQEHIHQTSVLTSGSMDALLGARFFFKCENFQKVGAFKFRGACNAVLSLDQASLQRGVATHSSGNHAAALSLAARIQGVPAYIVMPENAPAVKKQAVAGYGAKITFCESTLQAREANLAAVVAETGAIFIPPYDDRRIICGQGTAALELLQQVKKEGEDLDMVLAPVGGGGLLSGSACASKGVDAGIKVYGCEPAGADDAHRSFKAGQLLPSTNPKTIADGLLTSLSELTFGIIQARADDIVTAEEASIIQAMRMIWERMKIVIEPSSALPLAVLLEQKLDFSGKRVGIILSGGNVDLSRLPF